MVASDLASKLLGSCLCLLTAALSAHVAGDKQAAAELSRVSGCVASVTRNPANICQHPLAASTHSLRYQSTHGVHQHSCAGAVHAPR